MEPYQYDRIFTACLVAEDYYRKYPKGMITISRFVDNELLDSYKRDTRRFRSNMAKLRTNLNEIRTTEMDSIYSMVILWLFSTVKLDIHAIEEEFRWRGIEYDYTRMTRPFNSIRKPSGGILISRTPEPQDKTKMDAYIAKFDALLRLPRDQQRRQLMAFKLALA